MSHKRTPSLSWLKFENSHVRSKPTTAESSESKKIYNLHILIKLKLATDRVKVGMLVLHYENTPMQYTAIFHGRKNDNFPMKNCDIFHIFAQNIDCGYTLEPPQ